MVKLALLRLRTLRVLAHSVLLFAAMAYSYSGKDLIGQRLALHHSPISRPFQEERDVHFATSQRPLPGLEAAQPLPTAVQEYVHLGLAGCLAGWLIGCKRILTHHL